MASSTPSPSCSSSSSSSLSTCLSLTPEQQDSQDDKENSSSSYKQDTTATTTSDASITRSQSVHKQIQAPRYVRSIPIGLQRANTTSSPVKQESSNTPGNAFSPVARRTSGPHPDDGVIRPSLPPRSESALGLYGPTTSPSKLQFSKSYNGAPDKKLQSLLYDYGDTTELSDLPSDPKTWTPSQLSIYLSHMLRLTPRPVIADVMRFVVQRGLTGKRFLRLRNQDLIEMNINISWCRVLSTARERLRRECLRGRIFGFTVQESNSSTTPSAEESEKGEETIESLFLRLPTSASATSLNQEWNKNSWRRTEGKKSRGRVRGIAKVFEEGTNDAPDELGRRRSLSSMREAELDEVSRIRRNRQESTDSEFSNVSSTGASYSSTLRSPKILIANSPYNPSEFEHPKDNVAEISGSESETEDQFTSSASKVNWASVEPLAMEETASLPETFFADLTVPESSTSSPSTPCAATFNIPSPRKIVPEDLQDTQEKGTSLNRTEDNYQSRILSHGQEAYAAVRARKQSDLSEVTDELSEEHLAYWNNLPADDQSSRPAVADNMSHSMPLHTETPDLLQEAVHESEKTLPLESAKMVFAESDGNIITMKKHPQSGGQYEHITRSISKRTRSVEDFGSLKFHTIQSNRNSIGGSTRTSLKDLFEDENGVKGDSKEGSTGLNSTAARRKDSKHLSDLFREDDTSDQYYSLKSRSGSIMILPRAEVEEMQARLKDLEQQLELAKSATASRASCHSKSSSAVSNTAPDVQDLEIDTERRRNSKSQAMSDWVKGALCEANTVVSGGAQEPSWLGLGSWALAAGLGIGIVVGEAVINKMRR